MLRFDEKLTITGNDDSAASASSSSDIATSFAAFSSDPSFLRDGANIASISVVEAERNSTIALPRGIIAGCRRRGTYE